MTPKKWLILPLLLLTVLLSACGDKEPSYDDRETFPEETYIEVADATVTFRGSLDREAYLPNTPVGEWLDKCAASDRDEQFDVYTLRHEHTEGDKTTFTYLIYYPHGGDSLSAAPELLEGEHGFVINLTYAKGSAPAGYTLSYLSVTLPTDNPPRLRLFYDGEVLGQLATVTEDPIPLA